MLSPDGKPVTEILDPVPEIERNRWLEVIREMLDTEEMYYDEHNYLHLTTGKNS